MSFVLSWTARSWRSSRRKHVRFLQALAANHAGTGHMIAGKRLAMSGGLEYQQHAGTW
jgi:hypothetical protein